MQWAAYEAKDWLLVADCKAALDPENRESGPIVGPVAAQYRRMEARARCAEILNSRAGS